MSRELPAKPNLEHLRKQAKALLRQAQQGEAAAVGRFGALAGPLPKLADAQHVIARDYGFGSWAALKQHVESVARALAPVEMLSAAVRASNAKMTADVFERYPELRARINEPMLNYGSHTALLAAVQRSDRRTVDVLLQAGADINARSRSWAGGMGVLDECAPEMASFLIERGAKVDVHSAARLGRLDELRELVSPGVGVVAARGAGGQTPLHFASTVEIARYLLEHGAEIDALDTQHESTPAQHMLRVIQARHYPRDRQDIARYLVAGGCRSDILMASALGDLDLVRWHLDADPSSIRMRVSETYFPKRESRSGGTIYVQQFGRNRTPHQIARDFGHAVVFELLMERSPQDVKVAQACELGDEEIFRALLASRPNLVEALSDADRRRLPDAAQNNNTNAVRLMLAAGWPVDSRGEFDMTPLQWAAWHGNAEMVQLILEYRPQLELDCEHRITALGCALHGSENGWHRDTGDYVTVAEALLNAGATAPTLSDDLEASEPVRDALWRHAERSRTTR